MSTYEPIMNALLLFLQQTCGLQNGGLFQTIQRRFVMWEDLVQNNTPLLQPAMIVYGGFGLGGGRTKYVRKMPGLPPIRQISRTLVVYARSAYATTPVGVDAINPGDSVFAPLVESVESAFLTAVDSEGRVTLGGLVSHCWIEGDSHWITPDIDPSGQGMITIPVEIMIP